MAYVWYFFYILIAVAVVVAVVGIVRKLISKDEEKGTASSAEGEKKTPKANEEDEDDAAPSNTSWLGVAGLFLTGVVVCAIAIVALSRPNLEPILQEVAELQAKNKALYTLLAVRDSLVDIRLNDANLLVNNINGILYEGYQINGENTKYTGVLNQLVVLGKAAEKTAGRVERLSAATRSNRAYTEQVELNGIRTLALAMGDSTMADAQRVWATAVATKRRSFADSVFVEAAIATPLKSAVGWNTQAINTLLVSERVSVDDFRRVADTVDSTAVALAKVTRATIATAVILRDYSNKEIDRRAISSKAATVLANL